MVFILASIVAFSLALISLYLGIAKPFCLCLYRGNDYLESRVKVYLLSKDESDESTGHIGPSAHTESRNVFLWPLMHKHVENITK